MKRTLLKSKLHRATVTEANLEYEGSVTIDAHLMEKADIVEFERVEIYDITNGNRFATYAITGPANSGVICLNGAAARLVAVGDLVIICTYADYDDTERQAHSPVVVMVDEKNRPKT